MSLTAIYKVESGAAKKRKKQAEQAEWASKNGPVVVTKTEVSNPNRTKVN